MSKYREKRNKTRACQEIAQRILGTVCGTKE